MTTDDLMIVTGLDQSLPSDTDGIMERIDKIIQQSVEEKNGYIALDACRDLVAVARLSGIALAKALYKIKQNWHHYDIREDFDDYVWEYVGLHKATVTRYVRIQKELFESVALPSETVEQLQQKNIKDLVPIANAVEDGVEITDEQWEEILSAPDFYTVSRIIREDVRGNEPRRGSVVLMMDEIGTLWAFCNEQRFFVGSLECNDEDETVQKAISRICRGAGIIEK